MTLGIGTDIIEIDRIRSAFLEHEERFLKRLFTERERSYCLTHRDPVPHLAARFCAKEAVVKALGTGIGKEVSWKEIEILNDPLGKPEVHLGPVLQDKIGPTLVLVSMSHCKLYAVATALWIKR